MDNICDLTAPSKRRYGPIFGSVRTMAESLKLFLRSVFCSGKPGLIERSLEREEAETRNPARTNDDVSVGVKKSVGTADDFRLLLKAPMNFSI